MVKRVSSTKSVIRFSVGPAATNEVAGSKIGATIDIADANEAVAEQWGPGMAYEVPLVLGRGERRACCN